MDWNSIFPQLITAVSAIVGTLAGASLARTSSRMNTRTEWLINSVRIKREYYAEVLHATNGLQETLQDAYSSRPRTITGDMGREDTTELDLWMQKRLHARVATETWLRVYAQRSIHAGRHVEQTMDSIENARFDIEHFLNKGLLDSSSNAAAMVNGRADLLEREIRLDNELNEIALLSELSTGRKSRRATATKRSNLEHASLSFKSEREDIAKNG